MYDLVMVDRENNKTVLKYNPHVNSLTYDDGTDVIQEPLVKINYKPVKPISRDNPGKKGNINTLKISLGLKCNFSCSYCSQATEIGNAADTNNDDAKEFMANLDSWLRGTPKRIEFWGGEPFVYWSKLKILVPALREKFPNAIFNMHTNGSLLNDEKIAFIEKYDIIICISHDGPNQKFRGPDPFNNPKTFAPIMNLLRLRPNKVSFNIVLHSKNFDLDGIANWFYQRIPNANLSLEGIVNTYDSYTLGYLGRFTPEEYHRLVDSIFLELVNHGKRYPMLTAKMHNFIDALKNRKPIETLGQKCGMDREDSISVDLDGNVTTCQNTGGQGEHKIGHVDQYDDITLNTATHFSFREECMECPLVQLCKGSCMFLEKDFFAQSCWNEYYYNIGILKAAMYHLTGMMLIGINGKILRPEYSEEHLVKYPDLKAFYA